MQTWPKTLQDSKNFAHDDRQNAVLVLPLLFEPLPRQFAVEPLRGANTLSGKPLIAGKFVGASTVGRCKKGSFHAACR